MATVYRFQAWDIVNDCFQRSSRWATKEAIDRARGEIIGEAAEIEDRFLGPEIVGMTARGFDPQHPPRNDFGS